MVGMVVYSCYPSTREIEGVGSEVQSHSQIHRELKATQERDFCLKNKNHHGNTSLECPYLRICFWNVSEEGRPILNVGGNWTNRRKQREHQHSPSLLCVWIWHKHCLMMLPSSPSHDEWISQNGAKISSKVLLSTVLSHQQGKWQMYPVDGNLL